MGFNLISTTNQLGTYTTGLPVTWIYQYVIHTFMKCISTNDKLTTEIHDETYDNMMYVIRCNAYTAVFNAFHINVVKYITELVHTCLIQ